MKLNFTDITFDNFKSAFLQQLECNLTSDVCFDYDISELNEVSIPDENNDMDLIYSIKKFKDFIFISAGWNNRSSYIIKSNGVDNQILKFLEDTFGYSEDTNFYIKKYMDTETYTVDGKVLHIYNII
jgi:hypothetical protein